MHTNRIRTRSRGARPLVTLLLVWALLASGATRAEQQAPDAPASVPVMHRGVELYRIYGAFGLMSPEERAARVEHRLDVAVADPGFDPDRLKVVEAETAAEIHYDDQTIAVITDAEVRESGRSRAAQAAMVVDRLKQAIRASREALTWRAVLRGVGIAAFDTLVFAGAAWALWRLRGRLLALARRRREPVAGARGLHPFDIAPVASLWSTAIRVGSLLLLAVAATIWLSLVLAALPWTQPAASRVYEFAAAPFAQFGRDVVAYLPRFFFVLATIVVTTFAVKVARLFFAQVDRGVVVFETFPADWGVPTYRLVRLLLLALGFVAIYPYIPGAQSPAFQGVSIFIGFLVSISSSSALSNVIAGTILTYTRAFKAGDVVKMADAYGIVEARSLLVTRVRTFKDVVVTVPNSLVLGGQVQNYTEAARGQGVVLHTTVTIGYDVPWRDVHAALVAAARRCRFVEPTPAPFVLQTSLNDFHVSYELNVFTRDQRLPTCYSELHERIQDCFAEAGIEIMSPAFYALRDGNTSTIPAEHRPPAEVPRAFELRLTREAMAPGEGEPRPK